jgi:hypothetical protein
LRFRAPRFGGLQARRLAMFGTRRPGGAPHHEEPPGAHINP